MQKQFLFSCAMVASLLTAHAIHAAAADAPESVKQLSEAALAEELNQLDAKADETMGSLTWREKKRKKAIFKELEHRATLADELAKLDKEFDAAYGEVSSEKKQRRQQIIDELNANE